MAGHLTVTERAQIAASYEVWNSVVAVHRWWRTVISGWENIDELVFMHFGAPPHFALGVRAWLNQKFPGRWLGRRGPHEWPARSPDLTLCDIFLWA